MEENIINKIKTLKRGETLTLLKHQTSLKELMKVIRETLEPENYEFSFSQKTKKYTIQCKW
jgi:hypothetical protein